MKYKIIGDSCCDYTKSYNELNWLDRVPLSIYLDDKYFVDDGSLDINKLINDISKSEDAPRSACPSPGEYLEHFSCDADDIYVVTLTEKLSGSYNSAVNAAKLFKEKNPKKNIHIFNSKSAASGQIAVCLKIHELVESGKKFNDVVYETENFISNINTFFVLENLEVFRKSGRLNHLQGIITQALQIKLVMSGTKDGEICKVGQALSIPRALEKMVYLLANAYERVKDENRRLVITHCNCLDRAKLVRDLILKVCNFNESIICSSGGISTIYANEGGIIVSF